MLYLCRFNNNILCKQKTNTTDMKTKHLFLTAILLVFSMLVVAEPVDPMRALEVAEQFAPQSAKAKRIKSKTAPEQSYEIVYTHRMPNSDRAAFYVVKLGEKGFVIISADDVANPILGYSYTNSWPTSISAEGDTILPLQVLSYLNDMALQIETAIEKYPNLESSDEWNNVGQKAVRKTSARKSADALPDSVGPLLTTTWGQGQYYNALCPEDAGGEDGHVPTGCVATAMAQIINYWGQKEEIKTRGIHSYDSQYGNLRVNYDSTSYDFSNMPDALTAESTPEQINAVAKLMYECGVAVNMQYSAGASASLNEDARAALINFYRFSPDLSIAERAYFSSKNWDKLLQSNIANNQPIYYAGQNLFNGGHAFICDGYNAVGYYHFNFGWGGLADGWYLTSAVSPIGMDFSSNQLVLVGIVPDNMGNVILGQSTGTSTFIVEEPLEFYHLMGHNAYEGTNYMNECNNHVLFQSADDATQLVLDILEHEDQNAIIYDGEWREELRSLYAGQENDLSPIVSTNNALQINYSGNLYYSGFHFAISRDEGCRRVSNIVASVETTTVHLMWQENGNATQWEIEYGEKGFAFGNGTRIVTESTRYDIIGLKKFTEYDIYIRSVCSVNDYGEWSKVSILSEAPYWTDVVTEQPEGYVEDEAGNITISSAEGLAWFAKLAGLGIKQPKNVFLSADVDLGKYKWKPIKLSHEVIFDGSGHLVQNTTIIEYSTENVGFFGNITNSSIKNLSLQNVNIVTRNSTCVGGLIGKCDVFAGDSIFILNCKLSGLVRYLSTTIASIGGIIGACRAYEGSDIYIANCQMCEKMEIIADARASIGGLAGVCEATETSNIYIKNCQMQSNIKGNYATLGGIIGLGRNLTIHNSSAISNLISKERAGGITGTTEYGTVIKNCYAGGTIKGLDSENKVGGIAGYDTGGIIKYCYFNFTTNIKGAICDQIHRTDTTNIVAFKINNNKYCQLIHPIVFDDKEFVDLVDVMNKGVEYINISNLRKWENDTNKINGGYPILGDYYTISCPNTSIPKLRNIVQGDSIGVVVNWKEYGDAPQWQIRYRLRDSSIYIIHTTNQNPDTIWNLQFGECYNFNIRPICDDLHHGAWTDNVIHTVTTPYWTEMVTSKPEGFIIDSIGNIIISSAEGLAWLASVVNGLNGEKANKLENQTVYLKVDVDMSKLRWTAIEGFQGKFDGGAHIIYGITIDEQSDNQGLFGHIKNAYIINTKLYDVNISALDNVGGLCGVLEDSKIDNCEINGSIYGVNHVGGLIGDMTNSSANHCHSQCMVRATSAVGGIAGVVKSTLSTISEDPPCVSCYMGNSSVVGTIVAHDTSVGGLIGSVNAGSGNITIENSVVQDSVSGFAYVGGFIGVVQGLSGIVTIRNSCSCSNVNANPSIVVVNYPEEYLNGNFIGQSIGNVFLSKCYVRENSIFSFMGSHHGNHSHLSITDTSTISNHEINARLISPVMINGNICNDAVSALNSWVTFMADTTYYTWDLDRTDANVECPCFGKIYNNECYYVTSLQTDSIWNTGVKLKWNTGDCVNTWRIEYGVHGFEKGEGIVIYTRDTIFEIDSLLMGTYYDFYVQAKCNENLFGSSDCITIKPDKKHWVDIITTKPDGYMEGENGSVYISSPEGLAWFISTSNGLNGETSNSFLNKTIYLLNDIDMSAYQWTPIKYFRGIFNGLNHQIIGLYINDKSNRNAMFDRIEIDGVVKNLIVSNSYMSGNYHIAGLVIDLAGVVVNCGICCEIHSKKGYAGLIAQYSCGQIINSYANGNIVGPNNIGGALGSNAGVLKNCYASSKIQAFVVDYLDRLSVNVGQFSGYDNIIYDDNIAYWLNSPYNKENSITAASTNVVGYFSFLGHDTTWDLSTPQIINGTYYYTLIDALNAWVDANNSEGQYLHWVADTAGVNGGFPIFAEEDTKYIIIFCNDDGTILQQDTLELGKMPEYRGGIPTKDSTEQYNYTFIGWDQELVPVTKNVTYHAQYEATLNQYKINFYNWDGTLLQSSMVNYGEWPTYYNSEPTRESDAQYTYTFTGWSPGLSMVTGHASYYAQYEETLNQYEVTFLNWDESVLQSGWYYYGEMPEYTGETPTKPEDVHYTYTFLNWTPEIVSVIENATYTAVYEAIEKVVTSTENSTSEPEQPRKVFMDGRLFIIRGEHIYSSQGHVIQ